MKEIHNFRPKSFPANTHKAYGQYVYRRGTEELSWLPDDAMWKAAFAYNINTIGHFYRADKHVSRYINFYYSPICSACVAEHNPDLYCEIHNLKYGDEEYALFQAWRIKNKIIQEASHVKRVI